MEQHEEGTPMETQEKEMTSLPVETVPDTAGPSASSLPPTTTTNAVEDDPPAAQTNDTRKDVETASVLSSSSLSDSGGSSASDGLDDDDEDADNDNWQSLNIMERRALKMARNHAFLRARGLIKEDKEKPHRFGGTTKVEGANDDYEEDETPQGMLLTFAENDSDTTTTTSSTRDSTYSTLLHRFPGREAEVRSLYAQLDFALRQQPQPSLPFPTYVPNPIWITGTPGTGKSVVTRAVIEQCVPPTTPTGVPVLVSYVEPHALPPPLSVEAVVTYLYKDIWRQLGWTSLAMQRRHKKRPRLPDKVVDVDTKPSEEEPSAKRSLRERKRIIDYTANTALQPSSSGRVDDWRRLGSARLGSVRFVVYLSTLVPCVGSKGTRTTRMYSLSAEESVSVCYSVIGARSSNWSIGDLIFRTPLFFSYTYQCCSKDR